MFPVALSIFTTVDLKTHLLHSLPGPPGRHFLLIYVMAMDCLRLRFSLHDLSFFVGVIFAAQCIEYYSDFQTKTNSDLDKKIPY